MADLSDASDQKLVALARQGEEEAFRELVRRYRPAVLELMHKMFGHGDSSEDLAQETFLKAFDALNQEPDVRKPANWLMRIAKNTAIIHKRRTRPDYPYSHLVVTPGHADPSAIAVSDSMDTPAQTPAGRDLEALRRAVERLRPRYRRCIKLRYMKKLSYDRLAEIMNIPRATVGTYLHRAKRELERVLGSAPDGSLADLADASNPDAEVP